ncbi:MAG: hypothetical protein H0X30_31210 [Anaerolineae bacterium]|nr:hypothetical protein [Anaerolineae bacterium]
MSRADIRSQIRPFPLVATYLTGWAGQRTFEQIYDDLIPSFNRLLCYRTEPFCSSRPESRQ